MGVKNLSTMDDPDQVAQMRMKVKELLEFDTNEGFQMQRKFLQGLVKLLNEDTDVFMKNKGLQILLPFLDSKDVKVLFGVVGVIAKLAAKDEDYTKIFIVEGAADKMIALCGSNVKMVVFNALACLANMCKSLESAIQLAERDLIFEAFAHVLLQIDEAELNKLAATCIANFGIHVEVRPIMRANGVMGHLLAAMEERKDDVDCLTQVARGFAAMAMESECQVDIVEARQLDTVLTLYKHENDEIKEFAMIALLNIALNGENKEAINMHDEYLSAVNHISQNGREGLKQMAQGVIKRLKEDAVSKMDDDVE